MGVLSEPPLLWAHLGYANVPTARNTHGSGTDLAGGDALWQPQCNQRDHWLQRREHRAVAACGDYAG